MPSVVALDEIGGLLGLRSLTPPNGIVKLARSEGVRFALPGESGRQIALAKLLVSLFSHSDSILYVYDWGMWNSAEGAELLHRVRTSEGFNYEVWDCNAELILTSERNYFLCCVQCLLFSGWDFFLISRDASQLIFASHDEFLDVVAFDEGQKIEVISVLQAFGLDLL